MYIYLFSGVRRLDEQTWSKNIVSFEIYTGWLVGCFGLNGPLRQYSSLYRAVSQTEGERKEKCQSREKMSKQPPTAPTASTVGPCPTQFIQEMEGCFRISQKRTDTCSSATAIA